MGFEFKKVKISSTQYGESELYELRLDGKLLGNVELKPVGDLSTEYSRNWNAIVDGKRIGLQTKVGAVARIIEARSVDIAERAVE